MRADYVSADLSKVADIEALWSEVTRLYPDGIDILVNNAGVVYYNSIADTPDDKWDELIAVMLSAAFHLTKRCLPAMKKKGWGRIVNMSSIGGLVAVKNITTYAAAKHGLMGLTKGVALENAAHGITCNTICPGAVKTPMANELFDMMTALGAGSAEDIEKSFLAKCESGKFVTSEQVAELVEFLCLSSASSQMTGASYLIDDGMTAQ